jgi:hypothetical protein
MIKSNISQDSMNEREQMGVIGEVDQESSVIMRESQQNRMS